MVPDGETCDNSYTQGSLVRTFLHLVCVIHPLIMLLFRQRIDGFLRVEGSRRTRTAPRKSTEFVIGRTTTSQTRSLANQFRHGRARSPGSLYNAQRSASGSHREYRPREAGPRRKSCSRVSRISWKGNERQSPMPHQCSANRQDEDCLRAACRPGP
jgi:hypothetical protein